MEGSFKHRRRGLLAGCVAMLVAGTASSPAQQVRATLYQRLGGYDVIAAIVDNLVPRLVADPALAHFFTGRSVDAKKRIRQLVVEQLCQATGGPCFYLGRSMTIAHAGLGITEAEWNAFTADFAAALDKVHPEAAEKEELFDLIVAFKPDIVGK